LCAANVREEDLPGALLVCGLLLARQKVKDKFSVTEIAGKQGHSGKRRKE
jgi:hypothetical protein